MFSIYVQLDLIRCIILAYILYIALNRKLSVIIFVGIMGGVLMGLLGIPKNIYTFKLLQETYTSLQLFNKVIRTGTGGLMFGALAFVMKTIWIKRDEIPNCICKILKCIYKIVLKPVSLFITSTYYLAYGLNLWKVKYREFLEQRNNQDKK